MAKTIIIDTEVRGVEEASEQIDGLDSKVDDLSGKKISIGLDQEKLKQQTEELQKTGDKISKLGEGIAGAFTLANGVVGTMGASIGFTSEEIQNAQEKSAAFLGIMQSMKPVTEGVGVAFDILGKILKTNPLILLATIIGGIIVSFLDFGKIIDGIKIGFQAVGDAAKVVWDGIVEGVKFAIDIYTQYLDLLTFGLLGINDAYKGYVDNIEAANEAERKRIAGLKEEEKQINKNIDKINGQIKATREAEKAVKERQDAVTKAYDIEIRLANAAGKNTEELERKKLEDVKKSIEERIKLKIQEFELEQKLIEEQARLSQNLSEQGNSLVAVGNKQYVKDLQKRNQATNDFITSLKNDLLETETQIQEGILSKQKEAYDKWKELESEKTAKAKEEAEKRAAFEKQVLDDLEVVQSKKSGDYLNGQQSMYDYNKQAAKSYYDYVATIGRDNVIADLELQRQVNETKIQMASDVLNTLSTLTELFGNKNEESAKKAFQVNKALSIADAIIKTYQSANAIFASAAANPVTTAFPAFPFIQAGLAVAGGIANVAKIAQTQFTGSGGAGGASAGGGFGSPSLPSVDTSSVAFQFPNAPNDNQPQPSRVYVVESDIANTQRRVNVAEANATFG